MQSDVTGAIKLETTQRPCSYLARQSSTLGDDFMRYILHEQCASQAPKHRQVALAPAMPVKIVPAFRVAWLGQSPAEGLLCGCVSSESCSEVLMPESRIAGLLIRRASK